MDLTGRVVTLALRDAPLVPAAWGRHVGVPLVVVGTIAQQSPEGLYVEPIQVVHLNDGTKVDHDLPFVGIFVPWRSLSSVAVHRAAAAPK
jgi:hypothetical protein